SDGAKGGPIGTSNVTVENAPEIWGRFHFPAPRQEEVRCGPASRPAACSAQRIDRLVSDSARTGHHHPDREALPQIHDFVGMPVDHAARERAGTISRHDHPVVDLDGDASQGHAPYAPREWDWALGRECYAVGQVAAL